MRRANAKVIPLLVAGMSTSPTEPGFYLSGTTCDSVLPCEPGFFCPGNAAATW